MWSHFDTAGPRTTDHTGTENYQNSLPLLSMFSIQNFIPFIECVIHSVNVFVKRIKYTSRERIYEFNLL